MTFQDNIDLSEDNKIMFCTELPPADKQGHPRRLPRVPPEERAEPRRRP